MKKNSIEAADEGCRGSEDEEEKYFKKKIKNINKVRTRRFCDVLRSKPKPCDGVIRLIS